MKIIHRDVKLENIFCEDDKETNIKLGDFDLACYINKIDYKKECGTPGYLAPEIFLPNFIYD